MGSCLDFGEKLDGYISDEGTEAGAEGVDQDVTKLSRATGDEDLMKFIGAGVEEAED